MYVNNLSTPSGWPQFVQRFRIYSAVQVALYSRCLNFWLNEKCKETGWLKNEHAILLQVQCIHTASLFWQTHQAQWHPTHQLSSHVKFTQCADRQTNSHVCCVRICLCVCLHMHVWVQGCASVAVCTVCQCVCLRGCVLLDWECQGWMWEHHTQTSRGEINSENNK